MLSSHTSSLRRYLGTLRAPGRARTCLLVLVLMTAPACASAAPRDDLSLSIPPVGAPQRSPSHPDLGAIIDDIESIEDILTQPPEDEAERQILLFRVDRLLADLVTHPVSESDRYFHHLAMGRVLAASGLMGRPAADRLAIQVLSEAADLDPQRAAPLYHRGKVMLRTSAYADAAQSLRQAKALGEGLPQDLDYHLALALQQSGQVDEAKVLLDTYLAAHPSDVNARRLLAYLATATGHATTEPMRIAFEGASLVTYRAKGSTWRIEHESLGFAVGLPLSWQLIAEVDNDRGGSLEIQAPPAIGANHQWRSDRLTIWSLDVEPGLTLEALQTAFLGAIDDLRDQTINRAPDGSVLHLRLIRAPYLGQAEIGDVYMTLSGNSAYVVEFWGDVTSHAQAEGQLAEIVRTFSPSLAIDSSKP